RRALALAIAGDGHEVEGCLGLDGARKIDEEKCRAFQHPNHHQFFTIQIAADLRTHFGYAVRNLLAGIENLKALGGRGFHADSIARFVASPPVQIAACKSEIDWRAGKEAADVENHERILDERCFPFCTLGHSACPLTGSCFRWPS